MAIDKTQKLEIRACYESNNYSVKKLMTIFPHCDISPKTVESWVSKEKWQKKRYQNEQEAIGKIIDDGLPLVEAQDIIRGSFKKDESESILINPEDIDEYAHLVGRELSYKVLHQHSMQSMMAENIVRSEQFAKNAKNIGTVATHQSILTSTFKALYGEIKYVSPLKEDSKVFTDEEIEAMSDEEIDNLIGE